MPDITMCKNQTCPMRKSCYRHTESGTEPNPRWQSWASWKPLMVGLDDHDDSHHGWACGGYWPTVERKDGAK